MGGRFDTSSMSAIMRGPDPAPWSPTVARVTPITRALEILRSYGWKAEKVRRLRAVQRTRARLFSFADILALKAGWSLLAIRLATTQWTVGDEAQDLSSHPHARLWHDL